MRGECLCFRLFAGALLFSLLMGVNVCAQRAAAPRVVDLTAADGTNLKATYFAAGRPGPGMLLLHQCNRQRKIWDELAKQMAASGLNVLTVDFRGFGESGGTPFDKLTQQEIARIVDQRFPGDVDTAFQYLAAQPGVSRDTIGGGGKLRSQSSGAIGAASRGSEVVGPAIGKERTRGWAAVFARFAEIAIDGRRGRR